METSFKPDLPSIKVAENGVSWQGHAGSEPGLAASRRSSGQDVRLAWVDLESDDEGVETFKFSWRRLFLHMGCVGAPAKPLAKLTCAAAGDTAAQRALKSYSLPQMHCLVLREPACS